MNAVPARGGFDITRVATLIDTVADAIRNGGRVYMLGDFQFGPVAMLDASEQPPTFGVSLDLVRGYIRHGWANLLGPFNRPESCC